MHISYTIWFYIRVMRNSYNGWLVVLFYGVSTLFGLFNTKLSHFDKSFKQFSLVKVHFFVYIQLHVKPVLFQTIQFSLSMQFKNTVKGKS